MIVLEIMGKDELVSGVCDNKNNNKSWYKFL